MGDVPKLVVVDGRVTPVLVMGLSTSGASGEALYESIDRVAAGFRVVRLRYPYIAGAVVAAESEEELARFVVALKASAGRPIYSSQPGICWRETLLRRCEVENTQKERGKDYYQWPSVSLLIEPDPYPKGPARVARPSSVGMPERILGPILDAVTAELELGGSEAGLPLVGVTVHLARANVGDGVGSLHLYVEAARRAMQQAKLQAGGALVVPVVRVGVPTPASLVEAVERLARDRGGRQIDYCESAGRVGFGRR